jgi:hypothetical protein
MLCNIVVTHYLSFAVKANVTDHRMVNNQQTIIYIVKVVAIYVGVMP